MGRAVRGPAPAPRSGRSPPCRRSDRRGRSRPGGGVVLHQRLDAARGRAEVGLDVPGGHHGVVRDRRARLPRVRRASRRSAVAGADPVRGAHRRAQRHRHAGAGAATAARRDAGDQRPRRQRRAATASKAWRPSSASCDRLLMEASPRAELRGRYAAADVVAFPSRWREPFGLVPVEAMACDTPVVATGTGGTGEFLADGVNALVHRPPRPRGPGRSGAAAWPAIPRSGGGSCSRAGRRRATLRSIVSPTCSSSGTSPRPTGSRAGCPPTGRRPARPDVPRTGERGARIL